MEVKSTSKGDLFRENIEVHVVDLLREGAANQTMSQERAQQIARMTLDALLPGQPPQVIYQCTLELCSKIREMLSLIPIIVKDYKANYLPGLTEPVSPDSQHQHKMEELSFRPLEEALSEGLWNSVGTQMYCVKCRAKRFDPHAIRLTMKNGRGAIKGKCPVCGTGMYKIGGN